MLAHIAAILFWVFGILSWVIICIARCNPALDETPMVVSWIASVGASVMALIIYIFAK